MRCDCNSAKCKTMGNAEQCNAEQCNAEQCKAINECRGPAYCKSVMSALWKQMCQSETVWAL